MKTLSPADADLHEVEMATRRKQMAPLVNDLLSPEIKADAGKLAMFEPLLQMLEMYVFADDDSKITAQAHAEARALCIQASKLVLL